MKVNAQTFQAVESDINQAVCDSAGIYNPVVQYIKRVAQNFYYCTQRIGVRKVQMIRTYAVPHDTKLQKSE